MSNFQQITNTKLEEVKSKLDGLPASISSFDTHESKTSAQHLSEIKNASVRGINNTGGIGDGSENHTSVALGYDRTGGQARALLVDASGRQSVDVNSATISDLTSLFNASVSDINNLDQVGDGSSSHKSVALGYDRSGGKGRALLVDGSGRLKTSAMGNTEADGTGTHTHLHTDATGNVLTQVVNTINVAPADSLNSGTQNDPTNSVAVGLRARQTIGDASTETFLKCDASGVLQVSSSGGGGGDASSANQSTMITHLSEIEGAVETLEGCVSGSEVQVDIVSQPAKTHTFDQQTTNVLVPTGGDTQRITEGANIDLQSTKEVSVTLVTTSADAQADINAQLEFSHDGSTFFTDHTGASSIWALSSDIQGVSRGLYIYEVSGLTPMKPRARYMRVIYNHMDNSGSNISVTARIVQHAI
tara:strand:+ start:6036 stop:7289 length:1254 start_codon:yes stop_codon:yes gene_type:complete